MYSSLIDLEDTSGLMQSKAATMAGTLKSNLANLQTTFLHFADSNLTAGRGRQSLTIRGATRWRRSVNRPVMCHNFSRNCAASMRRKIKKGEKIKKELTKSYNYRIITLMEDVNICKRWATLLLYNHFIIKNLLSLEYWRVDLE
jgi:hypothetical protein